MTIEDQDRPSIRQFFFHSKLGAMLKSAALWSLIGSPFISFIFMGGLSRPVRVWEIWKQNWDTMLWLLPLIALVWAQTISFFSIFHRSYLTPWIFTLAPKRWRYFLIVLTGFLLGGLCIFIIHGIGFYLLGVNIAPPGKVLDYAGIAALLGVAFGNMFAAFHENELRIRETERRERELKRLRLEGELISLNLRIRPHFFFNALNTLASLIDKDVAQAQEFLADLADLFRLSFNHGAKAHLVRWADERRLVEHYLILERTRFGQRLSWQIEVEADDESPFPAFLLQPLVENAVHHGLASMQGAAEIHIGGAYRTGRWELEIANDAPASVAEIRIRPGHALESLQRRLELMNGRLDFRIEKGKVHARIAWEQLPFL